jgi:hypothetical protein
MIQIRFMCWTRPCTNSFTVQHQSKDRRRASNAGLSTHVVLLNSGNVTTRVSRLMFLQKYNRPLEACALYALFDSRILSSTPVIVRMSVRLALLVSCQAFFRPTRIVITSDLSSSQLPALPSRKSSIPDVAPGSRVNIIAKLKDVFCSN